ncbi:MULTISPECIES: hypothetical protein [unclassified Granulicatella]|uniref:hypothetical protein n=1 Tax=unclassified Granulicatella TaxID=2630493 RepID=UPI001073A598|nr:MULTISPECIES: hypothetical protein [unclassified Granulicatella]MBF0779847.1 hypothetical protein [Granulicatella sp. 19428wC4_WM01]TFU96147.1 hypothetical protein E4T68_01945 [Granulicatella sp. WM01]
MKEFPNYLMSEANQQYKRQKQESLPSVSVIASLKTTTHDYHEQKRRVYQEKELASLEQNPRKPFIPKILPPSLQVNRLEQVDYHTIKERLRWSDNDVLLFDENQCVLHENLKIMSTSVEEKTTHVKPTKRGLNQSMNGILEKEISPNRYFNKSK